MSRVIALTILAAALTAGAKKPEPEWRTAVVLDRSHRTENADVQVGVPGAGDQHTRDQFDLDDGKTIYMVEGVFLRSQRLELPPGSKVQFAIDGRDVLIRMPKGKPRKLKLLESFPNRAPSLKPVP